MESMEAVCDGLRNFQNSEDWAEVREEEGVSAEIAAK
jgi:hypothetical protein